MSSRFLANRRSLLKTAAAGAIGALATPLAVHAAENFGAQRPKGRLKQSVCRWCYSSIPLDHLAEAAARMGFSSVELLSPEEYPTVKRYGLTCAMVKCRSIADGLNRKKNHGWIEKELRRHIEFAADEGLPNVICMSGNRRGLADDEGLETCAIGLKRVLGLAEKKKVTVCMEGLNSKVDHHDYMYDHTSWGVRLAQKLGSPRFKLLYDIYHMQIMEGDVIATIRRYKDYIAHYHTGGVPGRHEIDQTQELNYPAVVRAILDTGFNGYLAQEFIPAGHDALAALAQGFRICDV